MAASVSVSVEVTLVSSGTSDQRFLITCRTNAMKAVVRINAGLSHMAILNHKSDSEMKTVSFIFDITNDCKESLKAFKTSYSSRYDQPNFQQSKT